MKLITWNINSVRLRLAQLQKLIEQTQADVICLQEIKAENKVFPTDELKALGFEHQAVRGMKAYNGVAILSRQPFKMIESINFAGRDDARHIAVELKGGVELHNFYVPAGGDIPDPAVNEKFAHKLQFLNELTAWSQAGAGRSRIMVGDLNIAPLPDDVWSHKQLLDVVSHTPIETEGLNKVLEVGAWCDALRQLTPAPEKLYSWWSYRSPDWEKSDRGRRLDHIWLAEHMSRQLQDGGVLKDARGWQQPSDHAPVWIDLSL